MRLLTCSFSLFLISSLTAQELIHRSHDLRQLVAPLPGFIGQFDEPVLALPIGPVIPDGDGDGFISDGGRLSLERVAAPRLSASEFIGRLEHLWAPESGIGQHDGGILDLRASASVQARVHDILTLFKAIRGQSRRVTLFELPENAATGKASALTASEVDKLLETSPPVTATVAMIGLSVPWLWESGRSVRFVRDYDVEVAEKANISDPKLDVFFVGTRLGLCLTSMIDGRCLVRAGLQTSEQARPLIPRTLPGKGLGALHLPAIEVLEIVASAAVQTGGGLLVTGDRGRRSWLLRIESGVSQPLQIGKVTAMPLGSLAVQPLSANSSRRIDFVQIIGKEQPRRPKPRNAPDALAKLNNGAGDQLSSDPRHAQAFGSHVVLIGSADLRTAVEKQLQEQAASLQTTSLTFRVGTVANAQVFGHLAGRISASELAEALPREACIATLPSHNFAIVLGQELSYVADYDVEIAGKVSAANPVVETTFDGFRISGALHRTPGKIPHLDLRLQWGKIQAIDPMNLANSALGTVDTVISAWTDAEQGIDIPGNDWHVAHLQPDPAAPMERSLVLMLRAQ